MADPSHTRTRLCVRLSVQKCPAARLERVVTGGSILGGPRASPATGLSEQPNAAMRRKRAKNSVWVAVLHLHELFALRVEPKRKAGHQ